MNVDEGKETAKGGVSLFIVVLVIAVVVSLVMLGLGWFNRGSAKLSDTVNSLDSSQFSSYNESIITGDQVRSAIQSFITQDVVLVVDAQKADPANYYQGGSAGFNSGKNTVTTPGGATAACMYNVGLIASMDTGGTPANGTLIADAADGKLYAGATPSTATGVLTTAKNTSMKPLQTKRMGGATNPNYIAPGAKYYCTVINDPTTGTACGILFTLMND